MRLAFVVGVLSGLVTGQITWKNHQATVSTQHQVDTINCMPGLDCTRVGVQGNIGLSYDGGYGNPTTTCDAGAPGPSQFFGLFSPTTHTCNQIPACGVSCSQSCSAGQYVTGTTSTGGVSCDTPAGGVSSITTTAPITTTGGATPNIGCTSASASVGGCLTAGAQSVVGVKTFTNTVNVLQLDSTGVVRSRTGCGSTAFFADDGLGCGGGFWTSGRGGPMVFRVENVVADTTALIPNYLFQPRASQDAGAMFVDFREVDGGSIFACYSAQGCIARSSIDVGPNGITVDGGLSLSGAAAKLLLNYSAGTTGQCLQSAGTSATPTWGTCYTPTDHRYFIDGFLPIMTAANGIVVVQQHLRVAMDLQETYTATIMTAGSDADHTYTYDAFQVGGSALCTSAAIACNATGVKSTTCSTSLAAGQDIQLRMNDTSCTGTAPSINLSLGYN